MTDEQKMTYAGVGVDYGAMDPFKRMAQEAACRTAKQIGRLGFKEVASSRGESAYLVETPDAYYAHVEEGLGTKCLVADAMYKLTGKSYYDQIAQDTVAMIVNDMVTLGGLPISVAMHYAVGASDWFKDETRSRDLIAGWAKACELARCTWGGGETPTLKGVVRADAAVLAGSSFGVIKPKERKLDASRIRHGDVIVLIESSGIHANGLTMARKIADKLADGYLTKLPDGRTYGETLLDPTEIYVRLIEDCLDAGVDLHYAVNVTGHGWRKLMRAPQPFTYVIDHLPRPKPIFDFMQTYGPISDEEAYGNLNMGAGFALYLPRGDLKKVWNILHGYEYPHRYAAVLAGRIKASDKKKVMIRPKNLTFSAETLQVR